LLHLPEVQYLRGQEANLLIGVAQSG